MAIANASCAYQGGQDAASFLAKHSHHVDVWRIPGLHLGEYTHVVAVAQVGQPVGDPARTALDLVHKLLVLIPERST